MSKIATYLEVRYAVGDESYEDRGNETWITIERVSALAEITICAQPAYTTTSVAEYARARGEDPKAVRERVERALGALSAPTRASEPARARTPAYGPGSKFSWFLDRALLAEQEAARDAGFTNISSSIGKLFFTCVNLILITDPFSVLFIRNGTIIPSTLR